MLAMPPFSLVVSSADLSRLLTAHVGEPCDVTLLPESGGSTLSIAWTAKRIGAPALSGRVLLTSYLDESAIRVEALVSQHVPEDAAAVVVEPQAAVGSVEERLGLISGRARRLLEKATAMPDLPGEFIDALRGIVEAAT